MEGQLFTNAVSVPTLAQAPKQWLEQCDVLVLDFKPMPRGLYLYGLSSDRQFLRKRYIRQSLTPDPYNSLFRHERKMMNPYPPIS
jgi:hypothetical protein